MEEPTQSYSSDVAFTPAVKAAQTRKGSRSTYAAVEDRGGWPTRITADVAEFIAEQTSVFLATASRDGQPYIQHRGGPPGFLRVIDETTLGFVDFVGNRQFITLGNLAENARAQLFLIDFATSRRLKIWGCARVVESNDSLTAELMPKGYRAKPSQVILFKVSAWDVNCPQHIPVRIGASNVAAALANRDERISALEAEVAALRAAVSSAR
jgi:hypothetical protein